MSIAVIITDRNTDGLCQRLQTALPDQLVQQWPNITHPELVQLAVLWDHPVGITENMPSLKRVVSMGAGMDHIEADILISPEIKRSRIVTPALKQYMAQYVLQHILKDLRQQTGYEKQQLGRVWKVLEEPVKVPTVGFLGLGELGTFVADQCLALGFQTMAWTLRQKHQVHPCFNGESGLKQVCENCQYLVVLLPLNERTHHIIDAKTLKWCGPDTTVINVGRGGHVDESALLNSLDNEEIKQAVLDVFNQEPLPAEHPFWSHPKITLTPHSSARSDVNQTATEIVKIYQHQIDN